MKIKALKAFKFSENGHTVISVDKAEVISVSEIMGTRLVESGKAQAPAKIKVTESAKDKTKEK